MASLTVKWRMHTALIIFCCSMYTAGKAQGVQQPDTIDVAAIKLSASLIKNALYYADSTDALKPETLPQLSFKNTLNEPLKADYQLLKSVVYLKFVLRNSGDTAMRVYFMPGFYYQDIQLYRLTPSGGQAVQVPPYVTDHTGFKEVRVEAGQSCVLFARLQFVKLNGIKVNPELVQDYYLTSYINDKKDTITYKDVNIFTFVFTGILLMMIFYSVAVFMLNGNVEFLYYSGYAFFMALMFFVKAYYFRAPSYFIYFFECYLDFIMQFTGTFIYLAFLRSFINSKVNFPFLHKVFLLQQIVIIVSLSVFTYLYFYTNNFQALDVVEYGSKVVMLACAVIFIVYTVRFSKRRLYYLAIGHFFLLCGSLISLYLMLSAVNFGKSVPKILNNSLLYYEIGLAVELMFFLVALASKNRHDIIEKTKESERLKLKNERQELEKQLAVLSAKQEERSRISADMHDELGSGVTAIRLMSEIVKSKMKENTLPEIHRISNAANDLINKMNTIIWTMKSEHDTLESLITYIRIYALEFFENTPIECYVNIPSVLPNIEINGEKRRNIFLSVKESLNNVLKHSTGTKVVLSFVMMEHLVITICDNGIGIDLRKLRQFGNGLSNIKKRIEGINGRYTIENDVHAGAITTFVLEV